MRASSTFRTSITVSSLQLKVGLVSRDSRGRVCDTSHRFKRLGVFIGKAGAQSQTLVALLEINRSICGQGLLRRWEVDLFDFISRIK